GRGEACHAIVLRAVANRSPARVVAILLAASCVAANGLEMSFGERANPDRRPRRRYDDLADPPKLSRITDSLATSIDVYEAASDAAAANSRQRLGHVTKSRFRRRPARGFRDARGRVLPRPGRSFDRQSLTRHSKAIERESGASASHAAPGSSMAQSSSLTLSRSP